MAKSTFIRILSAAILSSIIIGCVDEIQCPNTQVGMQDVVFHAGWGSETKTVLQEDGSVLWSPGDEISLFTGNGRNGGYKLTSTNTAASAEVEFKGKISENTSEYYALYPFDENAYCQDGKIYATVPHIQYASPSNFSPGQFKSIAKANDNHLSFYNLCSGIKFSVANEGITKVVFNGDHICGTVAAQFTDNDTIIYDYSNALYSNITVYPLTGDSFIPGQYYYVATVPMPEYRRFYVDYYTKSKFAEYNDGHDIKIERAHIKRIIDKDKDLHFIDTEYAGFDTNIILPQEVDKETITNVYFHTQSDIITETVISSSTDHPNYIPIYFEMKGTEAHYYTKSSSYVARICDMMFQGWSKLKSLDLSMFDTGCSRSMGMMFENCYSLENVNLSSFNTEHVETFTGMFRHCRNLRSLNISNFNSNSLIHGVDGTNGGADGMFDRCFNLTRLDLGECDLSTCGLFHAMFHVARYSHNCAIRCTAETKAALQEEESLLGYTNKYITWVQPNEDIPALEPIIDPGLYYSSDYSKDKSYRILNKATEGDGVNIIILGEAYSDRSMSKYDNDAETAMEYIFSLEPFKSYRNLFNVIQVYAVSENETLDGKLAFDYFNSELIDGTSRFDSNGILGYTSDDIVKLYEDVALNQLKNRIHTTVFLINDERYAGFAAHQTLWDPEKYYDYAFPPDESVAYVHTHIDNFQYLVCHEFGHAFAMLFEEYVEQNGMMDTWESDMMKLFQLHLGWWRNVDFTSDPNIISWHRFLEDPRYDESDVSIIEGARYSIGIWRSVDQSMMNSGGNYSVPAREIIYKTIHKRAFGDSWQYDYETFVKQDLKNIQPSTKSTHSKIPHPAMGNKKHFIKMEEAMLGDGRKSCKVIMD